MNARRSAERFIRRWFMKEFADVGCCLKSTPSTGGPFIQVRTYLSPTPIAIGAVQNFMVCVGDPVPANKFWWIIQATGVTESTSANQSAPALWAVPDNHPAGQQAASHNEAYFRNPLFTQSANVCNDVPIVPPAYRCDDMTTNDNSGPSFSPAHTGFEWTMLRDGHALYLPSQWQLAMSNHPNIAGAGTLGAQWMLKLVFIELFNGQCPNLPR